LKSLRNEASADRVVERARSMQIPVEKYRAGGGAGGFWRLRVGGFASPDAARTRAAQIKAELGLDGVWIVRR
jgi:cell division septation protein DedD